MTPSNLYSFILVTLLTIGSSISAAAFQSSSDNNNTRSIFDELTREESLQITLTTDFKQLFGNRRTDEKQEAVISYVNQDGVVKNWDLKVRLRGRFRRQTCEFPPIKLDFDKDQLQAAGLSDYDKLKLVTHCIDQRSSGNANVLKEYLSYKLYNALTDYSFRVQLVEITYKDVNGEEDDLTRYGFLIEDVDQMAARLGGKECDDCINMSADKLNTYQEHMQALFQYMIGNEDWSTGMIRNLKVIELDNAPGKFIYVPYDFDFCGLVNARYAVPNADYRLSSVKDRVYMGKPVDTEVFADVVAVFENSKKELLGVIKDTKALPGHQRAAMKTYIYEFYSMLDNLDVPVKGQGDDSAVAIEGN